MESRSGLEKPSFLKKGFIFCMKTDHESTTQKHMKTSIHCTPYLTNDKSPVSEGEEHHMKNENEIDESNKSQLRF